MLKMLAKQCQIEVVGREKDVLFQVIPEMDRHRFAIDFACNDAVVVCNGISKIVHLDRSFFVRFCSFSDIIITISIFL
jgi:hypothetical protein